MNVLLRFYDCPPETVMVDGTDIRNLDITSLRSHMGLVSQETLLLHDTLRNNIMYGVSDASEDDLQKAIERARLAARDFESRVSTNSTTGACGARMIGRALARSSEPKDEIIAFAPKDDAA